MSSLFAALRPIALDFLPTIVFAALTAAHVDVAVATACALGVGAAELLIVKAMGRSIGLLQWAGLGLAAVFGAAAILAHDPRFVMAKPTLIYIAIGVVMLKRGWMVRYMPARRKDHADLMIRWGYVWAGLMFLTAALNAVVALEFTHAWPGFIAFFPLPSKLALFAVQYVTIRRTIIRRETAAALPQAA